MELSDVWGLAGLPFITALVQVAKPWVPDERWWPVLAMALGLALNVGIALAQASDLPTAVVLGVVVGLAAAGLYNSQKTIRGT